MTQKTHRKAHYNFYEKNYKSLLETTVKEVREAISEDMSKFLLIRQNLNILKKSSVHTNNLNHSIAKYITFIKNIFDSLIDYFQKKPKQDNLFLFMMYMTQSGSFPMPNYFFDFELIRLNITPSGMIKIRNEKERYLIVGGFFIVRVLLRDIIFKLYLEERANDADENQFTT